jgi:tRNA(adenine34) deaminase
MDIFDDEYWMRMALAEAERAMEEGEVPVGAVLIQGNTVIGRGRNQVEALQDPTAHAEMIAITSSTETLKSRRLSDTTLYVTLEPCAMCAGAIVLARIERVVFGAWDPKAGACGTLMNILSDPRLNHQPEITSGVLADQCGAILSQFFQQLRTSVISGDNAGHH